MKRLDLSGLTLRPMNPVEVEAIRAYLLAATIARGLPRGPLHGGRSIIDRAAQKRLHPHRAADKDHFDVESLFTVEPLELGNFEGQLGNGNPRRRKSNFLELRRKRRHDQQKENNKKTNIFNSHIDPIES